MIKVIGYYNHNNIGDEQYKFTISKLLGNDDLDFIDCDSITDNQFLDTDIIVFGGGNLLCDYFIDKILSIFIFRPNKIIGVSVDMPFTEILLKTNKLDRLDYIFLRNKQDYNLFSKFYNPNKVGYLPDTSCILKEVKYNIDRNWNTFYKIPKNSKQNLIGITLCNNTIIDEMINFINYLITQDYQIALLSFNKHEDLKVHNKIVASIKDNDNIINIKYANYFDLFCIIKKCKLIISMRFHACLFAVHNKVPFIPLLKTKKIENLLKDINWEYNPWVNNIFNYEKLCNTFHNIINNNCILFHTFTINKTEFNTKFKDILNRPRESHESHGVLYLFEKIKNLKCMYDNETIVKYLSYVITGSFGSKYNHGILEKISDPNYNFINEIAWVIDDYYNQLQYIPKEEKEQLVLSEPNFNITYKNQNDVSGVHRSGWKYVYDNVLKFNNPKSDILLDLNVDETFHWNRNIYKLIGLIPYTKKWYGFIHHTFDEQFSEYNCVNLLKNEDFIVSLIHCNGLIVLSNYLKNILNLKLQEIGFNTPVYVIYHPTQCPQLKFEMTKFLKNENRKIYNIGTWLRNIYFFYKLNIDINYNSSLFTCNTITTKLNKAVLVGKDSNNYFPADTFIHDLKHFLGNIDNNSHNNERLCSHHTLKNNWYIHLLENVAGEINSVELVNFVDNHEYDQILSENIVFMRLIDGSAINALIECIVRNCPIVINQHPAVVELLGPNYPLYFDGKYTLNLSIKNIKKAHQYLVKLDKSKLSINTFIGSLHDIIGG